MRLAPILTSFVVAAVLYAFIFERDKLNAFANSPEMTVTIGEETTPSAPKAGGAVKVVTMRSVAQEVSSGIVLRGRTEAFRNVDVRAETTGLVTSEPIPKGTVVSAGTPMCKLDVGTCLLYTSDAADD